MMSAGAAGAVSGSVGSLAGSSTGAGGASGTGGAAPIEAGGADQGADAGAPAGGGAAGADGESEPSDVQAILDSYRSFAPQTPEPVSVSAYIFGLCRVPTLRETEFKASIHGDGRYLRDWANTLAGQGLASRGESAFPVGAVIVKEKYAGPPAVQPDLVAIALMIKRGVGFDPEHGDWDYAYYEPALGIVQTREQTAYCGNCHAGAVATDFVYVDGLKP